MPNAPLSGSIHPSYGPLVRTLVGHSEPDRRFLLSRVWDGPQPEIHTLLLVDTGAARTFLDRTIINRPRLGKRSVTRVITPGEREPKLVETFVASLQFVGDDGGTFRFNAWEVCAWDFSERHHQGLLGRDVLNVGSLNYKGRRRRFTLEF